MADTAAGGRNGHVYLVSAARTPIGKFGGALAGVPAVELGGVAIRAAVERAGLPARRPDRRGPDGPGPAGRRRPGAGAPGGARGGPARQHERDDDQPRLRLGAEGDHARRGRDPRRRRRGGRRRRHGVDEPGARTCFPKARFGYRLGNGELVDATVHDGLWCVDRGLPHGHPRRARGDHERGQPRGPGRVRADQPPEGDRGHRRGSVRGRDRARHDPRREGRRDVVVSVDEGPRRDSTTEALARAQAGIRPARWRGSRRRRRGHGDRRERARASRTARRRPSSPASAPSSGSASRRWRGSSAMPRPRSPRSGCSSPRSRASAACSTGSSCRSRHSTSSRSTRRSRRRRWPTAASSGSTGTRSTSTAARSPWATRSVQSGARIVATLPPRAAPPRGPLRPRHAVPRRWRLGRDGVRAGLNGTLDRS